MKNNYKIVIIDDDELAVDNLAFELKSYQQFNVEGIAKNGAMGKKLIFKYVTTSSGVMKRLLYSFGLTGRMNSKLTLILFQSRLTQKYCLRQYRVYSYSLCLLL